MILMAFSNLNDFMINTISAASVHIFWGGKQVNTGYSGLHLAFHILFPSAVKRKTAMITFPANTADP